MRCYSLYICTIAIMRPLLLLLCSLLVVRTSGQQIYISQAQKLSAEMIGFDILGTLSGGELLVYKKYRFDDEIDIYDKQMNLKRSKNLTLKNITYETKEFIKLGDRIFQFYEEKNGKVTYLKYQQYTLSLERKDEPVLIDSTVSRMGESYSGYRIIRSENEQYAMAYKYAYEGSDLSRTFLKVINQEGRIVMNSEFTLPVVDFSGEPVEVTLSALGRPVFLFHNLDFTCRKEKSDISYYFVFPGHGTAFTDTRINGIDGHCVQEMGFGIDNSNNLVVASGFFGDDGRYSMEGFAYLQINPTSGNIIHQSAYSYSSELKQSITGMMERSERYTPVYQVTEVLPRMDGGALLVGEYYDKNIENYDYTNYDPYYGYRTSTRQVEYYEYSDILLLSIDANGELDWSNIIRKRQLSKEDRGVNSSFGLINNYQQLYFLFNEDISQNSNVLLYQLAADGTLDRKSLFNPSKQEVELRPVAARQVSHNELVVPSIYKRNLAFIKVQL